jgi:hypothetical protein
MNTLTKALIGLLAIGTAGCASVNSTMPSTNTVTGEAWYGENTSFLGLTFSSRVWYCPAATGSAPVTCYEAKMVADGEASEVSTPAPKAAKPKPKPDDEADDEDNKPKKKPDDDADEDSKPKKKKNADDEDEDNKPKKKKPST